MCAQSVVYASCTFRASLAPKQVLGFVRLVQAMLSLTSNHLIYKQSGQATATRLSTFSLNATVFARLQMHFVTMAHVLEPQRAIVFSALSFVPHAGFLVKHFVTLWRASSVLGEELLEDYVSHMILHANRDSFFRCPLDAADPVKAHADLSTSAFIAALQSELSLSGLLGLLLMSCQQPSQLRG